MINAKDAKPWLLFYRLTQVVLFIFYKICFQFKSFGAGNLPNDSRGLLLTPNHASYIDPPILGITIRRPVTYLGKEYLFEPFPIGFLLRWLDVLPIKSREDDFRNIRQILRALKKGRAVAVFPEGTRTQTGQLQEPESGVGFLAVKSQAWVLPIYIRGTFEAFPKGAKWFKCCPVSVHYGTPFIPALDAALMAEEDPYLAVSKKIMDQIKILKDHAEREFNKKGDV